MKGIVIFVIITGILLQPFRSTFSLLEYELNKDFITRVLCINRDKPKLHCNGKCHLKKQLQADQQKEDTNSGAIKEKQSTDLMVNTFASQLPAPVPNVVAVTPARYLLLIPQGHTTRPFHPPAC